MSKINNLNEAILNIGKSRDNECGVPKTNDILYSRWDNRHSKTIGDFYHDFIEPRLPEVEVVRAWHKILMGYCEMDGAIFPIRDGYSDADDDKLKLRRGWLVRVDPDDDGNFEFGYTFADNHLATYIYKMALDGYCPATPEEFFDFMTEFKDPATIVWIQGRAIKNDSYKGDKRYFTSMPVHFGWIGKTSYPGSTESQKNVYINTTPAPTSPFGEYGYKHAHLFGVKSSTYKFCGRNTKWEDIKLVELGEECLEQEDYQWKDKIKNFAWDRKTKDANEKAALKEVVVANFLRFLDPMNHFLTPKRGCNKFTKKNNEYSLDIAEYDNLISYLAYIRQEIFNDDFTKFKDKVLASDDFAIADNSAEEIDIVYHEDKQESANKKNSKELAEEEAKKAAEKAAKKATSSSVSLSIKRTSSTKTSPHTMTGVPKKGKNSDKNYEIAAYYLRNQERMAIVGTKLLPTPDPKGSKTKSRLKPIGVLGEHKGLLIHTSIDDAIVNATDPVFRNTLEEIKKRGL